MRPGTRTSSTPGPVASHAVYTTDALAPGDRLAHFDHLQVHSEHPMHVASTAPEAFGVRARALDLAAVNIVDLACSTARVVRTPRLVRELDPELICVVVARSGRLVVSQVGRDVIVNAGDMALYSSSRPFQIQIDDDAGPARLVRMHMPHSLLSAAIPDLGDAVAMPLSGQRGVGALLGRFLTGVTTEADEYGPADLPRLGNLAVDLLIATLAHELGAPDSSTTPRRTLLSRIMGFVREHLHDAQMSPPSIAAAHHISVSHLHRLFQEHDTTVSAWIRRERLDRARRDLTDPDLAEMPVHRIAARWGYSDHATFTRAFRASFGVPPRDYRRRLHRALPTTGERGTPPPHTELSA